MLDVNGMQGAIMVKMGEYQLAQGTQKLITRDLGSCVGVAIRDPHIGLGGLLHVMLPGYMDHDPMAEIQRTRYADIGIEEMVNRLIIKGADRSRLEAKIAGAAHMIKLGNTPESSDISSRNLAAVRQKLAELKIPILASEVGGAYPRTVIYEPANGTFQIHTSGMPERML
ncbi:MAG: chemotaxis protein CheD [Roseburia sp.]|nr:chemotaxis protein CheD [Roseburia sp.]